MKNPYFRSILGAAMSVAVFAASAADSSRPVAGTLSIGTTGVGAHLTIPLAKDFHGRVGYNGFSYNYDGNTDNSDYTFKLRLKTIDGLIDYYPTASAFRVTAGLIYNGSDVTTVAKPRAGNLYTFQGRTYSAATAGQINGKADFRKSAPYLGIGTGNALVTQGLSFTADLGVAFIGKPQTSLALANCTAGTLVCNQLANDLVAENNSLQDKLNDFRFYPVVRVGISYRF